MCGIAGVVDLRGRTSPDDLSRLTAAMTATLAHRGPDDEAVWVDPDGGRAALGQRRLAIVDLTPTGRQPMASADGSVVVTYNGEIYNHVALRRALESRGHRFRGTSDTEVLVETIAAHGMDEALPRLNGMFAIAAWSRTTQTLTLVRDRLGEKPLYWARAGDHVVFGSELKALRAHPMLPTELDRDAVAAFMRWGYVPAPATILRDVAKLEAGTIVEIGPDRVGAPRRWWSVVPADRRRVDDATDELDALLRESVGLRLQADVPVGIFLSAGIDSTTVAALARQQRDDVRTFTVGFGDEDDETTAAAAIAEHLGTRHQTLRVDAGRSFEVVDRLPDLYDEPFADPSQVALTLVAEAAREHVKVALTGDGGDEVFGGYNRYVLAARADAMTRRVPRTAVVAAAALLQRMPTRVLDVVARPIGLPQGGSKLHKLATMLATEGAPARFDALVDVWPPDAAVTARGAKGLLWPGLPSDVESMMLLDTAVTLPEQMLVKVDRATMSVGLEARAPFLDHRVVELAWTLPLDRRVHDGVGKVIVRDLLRRYVPDAVMAGPKRGFDPPIGAWLRGPLRSWAEGRLRDGPAVRSGLLDRSVIERTWLEHLRGRRNHDYRLWHAVVLDAWLDRWGVADPVV